MSRSDRRCKVCGMNFGGGKHSIADEEQVMADNRIRAIVREEVEKAVKKSLAQLDGSIESAVHLLTGFSKEQLEELGGM